MLRPYTQIQWTIAFIMQKSINTELYAQLQNLGKPGEIVLDRSIKWIGWGGLLILLAAVVLARILTPASPSAPAVSRAGRRSCRST